MKMIVADDENFNFDDSGSQFSQSDIQMKQDEIIYKMPLSKIDEESNI